MRMKEAFEIGSVDCSLLLVDSGGVVMLLLVLLSLHTACVAPMSNGDTGPCTCSNGAWVALGWLLPWMEVAPGDSAEDAIITPAAAAPADAERAAVAMSCDFLFTGAVRGLPLL